MLNLLKEMGISNLLKKEYLIYNIEYCAKYGVHGCVCLSAKSEKNAIEIVKNCTIERYPKKRTSSDSNMRNIVEATFQIISVKNTGKKTRDLGIICMKP